MPLCNGTIQPTFTSPFSSDTRFNVAALAAAQVDVNLLCGVVGLRSTEGLLTLTPNCLGSCSELRE